MSLLRAAGDPTISGNPPNVCDGLEEADYGPNRYQRAHLYQLKRANLTASAEDVTKIFQIMGSYPEKLFETNRGTITEGRERKPLNYTGTEVSKLIKDFTTNFESKYISIHYFHFVMTSFRTV